MGQVTRSARGEFVDFELLAIKQQLASAPLPKAVVARQVAIAEKDGKSVSVPEQIDEGFLAIAQDAAQESSRAKSVKRK
jgi:hypothetical protein